MVFILWHVPVCGEDLYNCKMLKDVLLLLFTKRKIPQMLENMTEAK